MIKKLKTFLAKSFLNIAFVFFFIYGVLSFIGVDVDSLIGRFPFL